MSGAQRTKPAGNGNKSASNGKTQPSPPLRIEDAVVARTTNGEEAAKCDNDVRELQRASKVSYNPIEMVNEINYFAYHCRKSTAATVAS